MLDVGSDVLAIFVLEESAFSLQCAPHPGNFGVNPTLEFTESANSRPSGKESVTMSRARRCLLSIGGRYADTHLCLATAEGCMGLGMGSNRKKQKRAACRAFEETLGKGSMYSKAMEEKTMRISMQECPSKDKSDVRHASFVGFSCGAFSGQAVAATDSFDDNLKFVVPTSIDDACDSDAEIICAKLGGVQIDGGQLAVDQAIALYRALNRMEGLHVKEEPEGDDVEMKHGDGAGSDVGQAALQLQPVFREACVRDIQYSQRKISAEFKDG
jgi:hypothetical protein